MKHIICFRSYGDRKKRIEDSSAFEHIFVGESRDGAILGFHNWLRFYQLESLGYIDYRGYYELKRTRRCYKCSRMFIGNGKR